MIVMIEIRLQQRGFCLSNFSVLVAFLPEIFVVNDCCFTLEL